jgi:hypothetical protein
MRADSKALESSRGARSGKDAHVATKEVFRPDWQAAGSNRAASSLPPALKHELPGGLAVEWLAGRILAPRAKLAPEAAPPVDATGTRLSGGFVMG